jgi:hypothetical protein
MKRLLLSITVVLSVGLLLVACNDEGEQQETQNENGQDGSSENNNDTENTGDQEASSDEEAGEQDQEQTDNATEDAESSNGDYGEDQLGLKIGDTATVSNNFTKFEVTLDTVDVTEEAGNTPSELGNYVITNLTVKNLSDDPLTGEDAFGSTSLETKENSSGFPWYYIDGVVEAWDSEIPPGETQSGSLLFDVAKSEEYILTMGKHLEGLSNHVTFTFSPEEAK